MKISCNNIIINKKMSKFYIGQKVVAIKDHSQLLFKKGDEFVILRKEKKCCINCVDIGIESTIHKHVFLCTCKKRHKKTEPTQWFSEICFEPIKLSETTFEEIIKQLEPILN